MDQIHATTEQLYQWMLVHRKEIEHLANQGERLSMQVYASYKAFYHANRGADRKVAGRLESYFRRTMNEYIVRDLTITERVALRTKYGVHEDDPESLYTGGN